MSDTSEGSEWIVEPPANDSAIISLDIATDAEFTPAVRGALDELVAALQAQDPESAEVGGFNFGALGICSDNTCCAPQSIAPCVARLIITCRIVNCPTYGAQP